MPGRKKYLANSMGAVHSFLFLYQKLLGTCTPFPFSPWVYDWLSPDYKGTGCQCGWSNLPIPENQLLFPLLNFSQCGLRWITTGLRKVPAGEVLLECTECTFFRCSDGVTAPLLASTRFHWLGCFSRKQVFDFFIECVSNTSMMHCQQITYMTFEQGVVKGS